MPRIDWPGYLAAYHEERAGVGEALLQGSLAGSHTPYRWLARAVSAGARDVLDIGCRSGAMERELAAPGRLVVGVDPHPAELRIAVERGAVAVLVADPARLPFADGSFDAVTSARGLGQGHPTAALVAEAARVLRPGGALALMVPSHVPMSRADAALFGRLSALLRSRPRFPGPVERTGLARALRDAGLRRVDEARERYRFPVRSRADAELVVAAYYLPRTSDARVRRAVDFLTARAERTGVVAVPVPMRRIVALASPPAPE